MQVFVNGRLLDPDEWSMQNTTVTIKASALPSQGTAHITFQTDYLYQDVLTRVFDVKKLPPDPHISADERTCDHGATTSPRTP